MTQAEKPDLKLPAESWRVSSILKVVLFILIARSWIQGSRFEICRCVKNRVANLDRLEYNPFSNSQFPTYHFQLTIRIRGEVTELVPVPDFKSGGSWLWSGMVGSIPMLSRHFSKGLHTDAFPVVTLHTCSSLAVKIRCSGGHHAFVLFVPSKKSAHSLFP